MSEERKPEMFECERRELMRALAQAVGLILRAPVVSVAATFVQPGEKESLSVLAPRCETLYIGEPFRAAESLVKHHAQAIARLLPEQATQIAAKIHADVDQQENEAAEPKGQPS